MVEVKCLSSAVVTMVTGVLVTMVTRSELYMAQPDLCNLHEQTDLRTVSRSS